VIKKFFFSFATINFLQKEDNGKYFCLLRQKSLTQKSCFLQQLKFYKLKTMEHLFALFGKNL